LKYPLHSLLVRHGRGCVKCAANGVTTQDIVDTCPIQDLIVRSRSGKKKGGKAKKVKVENEEGKVVGEIKEDDEGHVEVDVKPEVKKEIGERNKVKEEEEVGVEDEVKQTKRPTRASKRARAPVKEEESSSGSDYSDNQEEDEEEEFKPKRPKMQRNSSSTLSDTLPKLKKSISSSPTKKQGNKKGAMTHSVDRDEAEMSGRVWKDVGEGAMHGMDG